jgi:hypothetical protein
MRSFVNPHPEHKFGQVIANLTHKGSNLVSVLMEMVAMISPPSPSSFDKRKEEKIGIQVGHSKKDRLFH